MLIRRTATVTMSAPDASCARCMTAKDEYLPVPTMRRDANSRPAMTRGSAKGLGIGDWGLVMATTHEIHNFHLVAVLNLRTVIVGALDDVHVVLHGHAAWIDVQLREQSGQRQRTGELVRLAVQRDRHFSSRNRFVIG